MTHPYKTLPERCFWKSAVSGYHMFEISDWHQPKFSIENLDIATAGSCFAQHIGSHLKRRKLHFIDVEQPPSFLKENLHISYGYGIFSARYGNIYTARGLLQLIRRAKGSFVPTENCWEKDGGWVDPFRPTIEPNPYISIDELDVQQKIHLENVKKLFSSCGVFIFTLGLTEAWVNRKDNAVYPIVPGTKQAGGIFDNEKYAFINFSYPEIIDDLKSFYRELIEINPLCKIILTVSPVPLVATATGKHVVSATTYSKSVLRAAAGCIADQFENIDYFPSYEIITSHVMGGSTYMPDKRGVSSFAVDMVMRTFFESYGITVPIEENTMLPSPKKNTHISKHLPRRESAKEENPHGGDKDTAASQVCDEEILNAFVTLRGKNA